MKLWTKNVGNKIIIIIALYLHVATCNLHQQFNENTFNDFLKSTLSTPNEFHRTSTSNKLVKRNILGNVTTNKNELTQQPYNNQSEVTFINEQGNSKTFRQPQERRYTTGEHFKLNIESDTLPNIQTHSGEKEYAIHAEYARGNSRSPLKINSDHERNFKPTWRQRIKSLRNSFRSKSADDDKSKEIAEILASVQNDIQSVQRKIKKSSAGIVSSANSRSGIYNNSSNSNWTGNNILQHFLKPTGKNQVTIMAEYIIQKSSDKSRPMNKSFPQSKMVNISSSLIPQTTSEERGEKRDYKDIKNNRPSILSFFEEENKLVPNIVDESNSFQTDDESDDDEYINDSELESDVDEKSDIDFEARNIPIISKLIHGSFNQDVEQDNERLKKYFVGNRVQNIIDETPDIGIQSADYDLMLDNYYSTYDNRTKTLPELSPSAKMELEDPEEHIDYIYRKNHGLITIKEEPTKHREGIPNRKHATRKTAMKPDPRANNNDISDVLESYYKISSKNLTEIVEISKRNKTNENKIIFFNVANSSSPNAVCMDGSLPGYYHRKGFSAGERKWIVHLHGGAWCYDLHSCLKRRSTILGSTRNSAKENISSFFHGILSKNSKVNPNFYNWNIAVLSYCDGGLFSGSRKKSIIGKGKEFNFQGRNVLRSLMEDLHSKSLRNATDVILSGTSAGGLALVLQGDFMRKFIPKNVKVRGLIDAGFFLDQASVTGYNTARQQFKALYNLHKPILNKRCLTSFPKKNRYLCLFPKNTIPYMKLPLYIVNSLYDHWQLSYLDGIYCVYNDKKCDTKQHDQILNFRNKMFATLTDVGRYKNDTGVFANSCLAHGQVILDYTWSKVKINGRTIGKSFYEWYEDDKLNKHTKRHFNADCKYPCNGTCPRTLAQRCVNHFKKASVRRQRRDAELC